MNYTPSEYKKYKLVKDVATGNSDSILTTFEQLLLELETCKEQEEILQEQVYFRDEFIESILEATNVCKNKRELVAYIKTTLENSYIEL